MGLQCLDQPEEYGGAGLGTKTACMVFEELAKSDAGVTCAFSVTGTAAVPVMKYGTEEQKQLCADILFRKGGLGSFCLTEPGSGSDSGASRMTAVRQGDSYVLNGTKCFITNGPCCDFVTVFAKTDVDARGVKGISAFIVESSWEGFSTGAVENKMGMHGSPTCDLIFENVRVPKENLLGGEGQGFKICMATLDSGRITVATQGLGIAQGALDEAVKYVKERVQFGKTIAKLQNTQFEIADMATRVECGRQLVYNAARLKDAGQPYSKNAAMAKYYCGDLCNNIAYRSLQLHGGYGYMKDYPIERMFRDARLVAIYEGTSEIQRVVIANHILGK